MSSFVAEVESAVHLFPVLNSRSVEVFKEFHDFTLTTGHPTGSVLASKRNTCRICNRTLSVDINSHVIVIYHAQRGTYSLIWAYLSLVTAHGLVISSRCVQRRIGYLV